MAQEQVIQNVIQAVENTVDEELQKLEDLTVKDLDALREQRIAQMKKDHEQQRTWIQNGHGVYEELPEEKCFFDTVKKSHNVVIHFYKSDAARCKIVDHHLKLIAPKHLEAKFVKLDAVKCPFLAERLNIRVIPTLLCIVDSKTVDKIVGFTDLGNTDEFTTETLEWRLGQSPVVKYTGNLNEPETNQTKRSNVSRVKKTIREKDSSDSDDSLD